jgi:hypothetical protein
LLLTFTTYWGRRCAQPSDRFTWSFVHDYNVQARILRNLY